MSKKTNICPYCEERPVKYPTLNCCHACYQWFDRWMKAGPARFLRRVQQIETLDTRARALMGRMPGINQKVTPIRKRRK